MQLSKYYRKTVLSGGQIAIYNTLMMRLIYVNDAELRQIEHFELSDQQLVRQMLDCGIYAIDESVDDDALKYQRGCFEKDLGSLNVVYVILTDACNLRCSYCAVKNIADKGCSTEVHFLESFIIHRFITGYLKYAQERAIDTVEFIFYGGEPLLNWSSLVDFVETFNELNNSGIDPSFSIVTNGTLVTDTMAAYFKKHNISVSLH